MSESQPPSYESSDSGTSHPSESHQPAPGSTGTGMGERFMGAMGAIHGAGENLRGNVIGALDTLFGGKHEEEAHRVAQRGQEEMHSGVKRMKGRSTAAAEGQPQPQGQEPAQQREQAPTQPHLQAQGQGQPVQTREQGQPQPAASQKQVEEPGQAKDERQAQQEPEQRGVVAPPDEQKIPVTSSY